MEEGVFILATVAIFGFGLISKRLEGTVVTAPMIFVTVGLLASPLALELTHIKEGALFTRVIASLTLILILFIDAMHIDRKGLWRNHLPKRLLAIGLPLTMVLGALFAKWLFPEFPWWQAAVLGILLSPTDAALGQHVVTNQDVPYHLREALNVESGLNDGLTLIALLVALSFGGVSGTSSGAGYWTEFFVLQILVAVVVGLAIGSVGGYLIETCSQREWMLPMYQRISALILALLAYALSDLLDGDGFISVFCAGFTLGIQTPEVRRRLFEFGEAEGQQFALLTFLIFGGAMIPLSYPHWELKMLYYALLSLTVIRMVPVAISLIGTRESWRTKLFLGWFGPRGLSSILFGLLIVREHKFPGSNTLISIVVLTVFLSVFLHGISAKASRVLLSSAQ